MKLSPEQTKAYDAIGEWQHGYANFFILAGYAGTGKTTLLQHFINQQSDLVMCLAPTGKAASVLQRKLTNARVSTIHKALYKPIPPSTATLDALEAELVNHPGHPDLIEAINHEKVRLADKDLGFSRKANCEISPDQLVVVDEASMVTVQMLNDLLRTNAKLLFVGDPGQLPPVNCRGFFQDNKPDVTLTQVHRQALDSPIIKASMQARNGESIARTTSDGAFRKMPKEGLHHEEWLQFDQVITGSNEARRKINRYFRGKRGFQSWWPEEGDKLICLKNDSEGNVMFINGVQGSALSKAYFNSDFGELIGDLMYDGQLVKSATLYRYPFQAHYDLAAVEEPWQGRQGLREFDYAYAITVHKAQGSEWDKVLIADDGMKAGDKEFRKRWLYTAITRAKEELTWLY